MTAMVNSGGTLLADLGKRKLKVNRQILVVSGRFRREVRTVSAAPQYPSNRYPWRRHKLLAAKAVCVCHLRAVLHYFLRTESGTESNHAGNGEISRRVARRVAYEEWGGTPHGLREVQK